MSGDKLHCSTCNLNDLSKLHLLPCLHASCKDCLLDALMCRDGIKSNAQQLSEDKDTPAEPSAKPATGNLDRVFSCPVCSYKILLNKSVIDNLVSLDSAVHSPPATLSKDDQNLKKAVHCSTCGQDLACSQYSNQSESRQSNPSPAHKSTGLFCATCDLSLCKSCVSADGPGAEHSTHTLCSLDDILQGRRRQLTGLTAQARGSAEEMSRRLNSLQSAQSHLDEVLQLLDLRTEELCNLIVSRRNALARELMKEHENCAVQYGHDTVASESLAQNLHDALHFTSATFSSQGASIENKADQNSYNSSDLRTTLSGLFSPVSSRLNDLVNTSGGRTAGGMGVTNLQLTAHGSMCGPWEVGLPVSETTSPYSIGEIKSKSSRHFSDNPKQLQSFQIHSAEVARDSASPNRLSLKAHPDDVAGIEKLFGSLVRGVVCCGGPRRVMTHSVNLTWPVALVITRSHDFVVAGKTGAFASEGKLMFYDRYANLISSHPYDKNRLPISMVTTSNGRVLVSDTSGSIAKFSSCGKLLEEWAGKFKVGKQSLEHCQQKPVVISHSFNIESKEVGMTPGGDCVNKSSDYKSFSSGKTCDKVSEESVSSLVRQQEGGERGGGEGDGVSVVGGKIVGGHMAVGPDGCVWVSSGCGRLIKYSTVDGLEIESLNLWRRVKSGSTSNMMLSHRDDENDDNVSNNDNSVNNSEKNGDTVQVKPETERQSAELNNCSDLLKIEVAIVRQIRKREESGHVLENEKDLKLFSKQTLSLDINSLAMDSNGCFVVCVQDQKAVYIFKPSGELVAAYPDVFESQSKMDLPSLQVNKNLRSNSLNTVSSFSEITDGWEVVEENAGTCKYSDLTNKVSESTESDKIVTDKENSTIDKLGTSLYGKKRDNNCDSLSINDSNTVIQSVANSQPVLKCPTAVCCDSFGNVLLADFTEDCVHLLSPSGRYLGQVVTPANGVACPNFVSLNSDSSLLYVGQYGGEVGVFEYMSYVKKV